MKQETSTHKKLSPEQHQMLLNNLKTRFEQNMKRHKGIDWNKVQAKLEGDPSKLWSLSEMERTGGEPDVVGEDKLSGEYIIMDCSPQTPAERRNCCYDREAQLGRKKFAPETNATDMAASMGIEILTEEDYQELQKTGEYDTKTSSWLRTPSAIRDLGGAIYGDRRYNHVFIYHNGADSYYAVRGFRGSLRV
ncbi:MAG TPA: DUF4256 domain-containing protein [Lentimicrobium sp.]|nr:DUF4256 domain-containing protein [Lentimicrobium sp.]